MSGMDEVCGTPVVPGKWRGWKKTTVESMGPGYCYLRLFTRRARPEVWQKCMMYPPWNQLHRCMQEYETVSWRQLKIRRTRRVWKTMPVWHIAPVDSGGKFDERCVMTECENDYVGAEEIVTDLFGNGDFVRGATNAVMRDSGSLLSATVAQYAAEKFKEASSRRKKLRYTCTVVVPGDVKRVFEACYPHIEVVYDFKRTTDHPLSEMRRDVEEMELFMGLPQDMTVVDVGGNYARHIIQGRRNFHSCCPLTDWRDAYRRSKRDYSLDLFARTCEDTAMLTLLAEYKRDPLKYVCANRAENCYRKAGLVVFIHSLYDIRFDSIAEIVAAHGCVSFRATMNFHPRMLVEKEGVLEELGIRFFRERRWMFKSCTKVWTDEFGVVQSEKVHAPMHVAMTTAQRNELLGDGVYLWRSAKDNCEYAYTGGDSEEVECIVFHFLTGCDNVYVHVFDEYVKHATRTFSVTNGTCFGVERYVRGGVMYLRGHRISMFDSHFSVAEHTLPYGYGGEYVVLNGYEYHSIGSKEVKQSLKPVQYLVATSTLHAEIQYGQRLAQKDFCPEAMLEYATSFNARFTLNGVDITTKERISPGAVDVLAMVALLEAFRLRGGMAYMASVFLGREMEVKAMRDWTPATVMRNYLAWKLSKSAGKLVPGWFVGLFNGGLWDDMRRFIAEETRAAHGVSAPHADERPLFQSFSDYLRGCVKPFEDRTVTTRYVDERLATIEELRRARVAELLNVLRVHVQTHPDKVERERAEATVEWLETNAEKSMALKGRRKRPFRNEATYRMNDMDMNKEDVESITSSTVPRSSAGGSETSPLLGEKVPGHEAPRGVAVGHDIPPLGCCLNHTKVINEGWNECEGGHGHYGEEGAKCHLCAGYSPPSLRGTGERDIPGGKAHRVMVNARDASYAAYDVVSSFEPHGGVIEGLVDGLCLLRDALVMPWTVIPRMLPVMSECAAAMAGAELVVTGEYEEVKASAFEDVVDLTSRTLKCTIGGCAVRNESIRSVYNYVLRASRSGEIPNICVFNAIARQTNTDVHDMIARVFARMSWSDALWSCQAFRGVSYDEMSTLCEILDIKLLVQLRGMSNREIEVGERGAVARVVCERSHMYASDDATQGRTGWFSLFNLLWKCGTDVYAQGARLGRTHGLLTGFFRSVLIRFLSSNARIWGYVVRWWYRNVEKNQLRDTYEERIRKMGPDIYHAADVIEGDSVKGLDELLGGDARHADADALAERTTILDDLERRYPISNKSRVARAVEMPSFDICMIDAFSALTKVDKRKIWKRYAERVGQVVAENRRSVGGVWDECDLILLCSLMRCNVYVAAVTSANAAILYTVFTGEPCVGVLCCYKNHWYTVEDASARHPVPAIVRNYHYACIKYGVVEKPKVRFSDDVVPPSQDHGVISSGGDTPLGTGQGVVDSARIAQTYVTDAEAAVANLWRYLVQEDKCMVDMHAMAYGDMTIAGKVTRNTARAFRTGEDKFGWACLLSNGYYKLPREYKSMTHVYVGSLGRIEATVFDGSESDWFRVPAATSVDDKVLCSETLSYYFNHYHQAALRKAAVSVFDPTRFLGMYIGVGGCGKSWNIVQKVERNSVVLATTRSAAENLAKKTSGKIDPSRVRTVDSFLQNCIGKLTAETLHVDEALALHPAYIYLLPEILSSRNVWYYGDFEQLNFMPRVPGHSMEGVWYPRFSETRVNLLTRRYPKDAVLINRRVYGNEHRTTSDVTNSISMKTISSVAMVPPYVEDSTRDDYFQVLTYTQSEKRAMIERGYANTRTIGEYQGQEADHIVVVRLNKYAVGVPFNDVHQCTVAVGREMKTFRYYRIESPPDSLSNGINSILGVDVNAEHDEPRRDQFGFGYQLPVSVRMATTKGSSNLEMWWVLYESVSNKLPYLDEVRMSFMQSVRARWGIVRDRFKIKQWWNNVSSRWLQSYSRVTRGVRVSPVLLNSCMERIFPYEEILDSGWIDYKIEVEDVDMVVCGELNLDARKAIYPRINRKTSRYLSRVLTHRRARRPASMKQALISLDKRNFKTPKYNPLDMSAEQVEDVLDVFFERACVKNWRDIVRRRNTVHYGKTTAAMADYLSRADHESIAKALRSVQNGESGSRELFSMIMKADPKSVYEPSSTSTYNAPQTIMFQDKLTNVQIVSVINDLLETIKAILQPRIALNTRKSLEDLENYFRATLVYDDLTTVQGDFSKYDKSQQGIAKALEMGLWWRLGVARVFIEDWHSQHIVTANVGYMYGLIVFLLYQRKSGDGTTSSGNSLYCLIITVYVYGELRFVCIVVLGDDSILFLRRADVDRLLVEAGPEKMAVLFNMDAKVYLTDVAYFCGYYVIVHDGVYLVRDPIRALDRLGRRDIERPELFEELYVSLCDTLRNYDNGPLRDILPPLVAWSYRVNDVGAIKLLVESLVTIKEDYRVFRSLWSETPEVVFSHKPDY